uniref:BHLH domain-containing protein n=1 Tax=Caenorhabditis tropicalis TaxID=1561998 RepID=A0A1I7TDS5_9PELO
MFHQEYFMNQHHRLHHHHQEVSTKNEESENPSDGGAVPVKREKRRYRCRKRSPATIERAKTVRRDKANARERRRMNSLNDALETLREILPSLPDEPKMTKIETLRKAQEYIATLNYQLSGSPSPSSTRCCDSGSCGMCSATPSLQSTPFQSPCFPPPNSVPYTYSTPQMYYHHQFPKQ